MLAHSIRSAQQLGILVPYFEHMGRETFRSSHLRVPGNKFRGGKDALGTGNDRSVNHPAIQDHDPSTGTDCGRPNSLRPFHLYLCGRKCGTGSDDL